MQSGSNYGMQLSYLLLYWKFMNASMDASAGNDENYDNSVSACEWRIAGR
jgi:hypothetical protein